MRVNMRIRSKERQNDLKWVVTDMIKYYETYKLTFVTVDDLAMPINREQQRL